MSKSLGNVLSIGALTEDYPAVAVRWALSTVHHRSAIEWGAETLPAAHAAWEKFSTFVARAIEAAGEAPVSEIALAPADLPGVRLLVDGRAVTSPEAWAGTPRITIGGGSAPAC